MKDKDLEAIYTIMYNIGYNDEEIDKILFDSNLVFIKESTLLKKLSDIYNLLISLGYSKSDVIKMTKLLPSLYSLSIENIKQKIIFLKESNLDFVILNDTKKLMQSIDLTFARYMYFKDNGITITSSNYRKLFYGNKVFEKQYSIDKITLLDKYNYQEYINNKKTLRKVSGISI